MRNKIKIKSKKDIKVMQEGGKKLSTIKAKLTQAIKENVSAAEIENMAVRLIAKAGGKPSFKIVPGYSWATCININKGVVHGIPKRNVVFKKGDVVSVDIGLFYKGFHTDTSFSVGIDPDIKTIDFLNTGKKALNAAIKKAIPENRVYDISKTIQDSIETAGFSPIKALVGHGIGKSLHEEPKIPCFVKGKKEISPVIPEGAVLAIEVMYSEGSPDISVGKDGWTIVTSDGKIAALFEETVAIMSNGPLVLTR